MTQGLRFLVNEVREQQRVLDELQKSARDQQDRLRMSINNLNNYMKSQSAANMLKETDVPLEEQINKLGT